MGNEIHQRRRVQVEACGRNKYMLAKAKQSAEIVSRLSIIGMKKRQ